MNYNINTYYFHFYPVLSTGTFLGCVQEFLHNYARLFQSFPVLSTCVHGLLLVGRFLRA